MGLKHFWRRFATLAHRSSSTDRTVDSKLPEMSSLERRLGYSFQQPELLRRALLHRSHSLIATQRQRLESNERLEFLGDAVLGMVVNDFLYRSYPTTSEGGLTKMKSLLVCRNRLAEVAAGLNLGAHIRMSASEAATGGRSRASILADATEAVIGAVYLDGGLAGAHRVIHRCLLDGCEQILLDRGLENFKSRLQEIVQARYKAPPRYRVVACEGPDHARVFRVSVSFKAHLLGQGVGPSKKIAEQAAARQALATLASCDDLLDQIVQPTED